MAGQLPDARSLQSWEDAFQHPLPVVRKLEQQLRKNIDDNRQKLRSLVGASYRDLLGTAERIIEMDDQMQTVEASLGDIGRKSNARMLESIGKNHARLRKVKHGQDEDKHAAIVQTKILQRAMMILSRTIKAGGDALQASKLLVLSRLLYKTVSESEYAPPLANEPSRKLATLRKKLLVYIERIMVRSTGDRALLVNTLCAYALITSSTPREVLRRFLQVRYEQLESKSESMSQSNISGMLDLYSRTLLDTRYLFPKRFSDALFQLAKVPLLQDHQLQLTSELSLDIYGGWIAHDIQTFTTWVRHDELASSEMSDALASWATQGHECLLRGLQQSLRASDDPHAIKEARHEVLSQYLSLCSKLRNDVSLDAFHDLREVFFKRLEELGADSATLSDLAIDEPDISNSGKLEPATQSLWDLAAEDVDLSHGAAKFRQSIIRTRHGRSRTIQSVNEELDKWVKRIVDFLDLIDEMRATRWDGDVDFEIDDLEGSESLMRTLKIEDSDKLQERLRHATQAAIEQVLEKVTSASQTTTNAAFYIRVDKEIEYRRRTFESRLDVPRGKLSRSLLYRTLARSTSQRAIDEYIQSVKGPFRPAVGLWDGSPPLPVQPAPTVFTFLSCLHRAMTDAGTDLWSPQCVFEMKSVVLDALKAGFDHDRSNHPTPESSLTNGHVEPDHNAERQTLDQVNGMSATSHAKKERLLQDLFDVYYLQRVLCCSDENSPKQGGLASIVRAKIGELELDVVSSERLNKSANEYWKRTYLLFGLLSSGSDQVGG